MSSAAIGFVTALSLILAIGAQNAFVLRQGLARQHVLPLCLLCATSDAILITAGVLGFGALVESAPWFPLAMTIGGAAFLIAYGINRLLAAKKGGQGLELSGQSASLGRTLAVGAAFTWLNPHVYLDTVGLIGAISTAHLGPDKLAFGIGAVTASFVFFFSLGYGARWLSPIMQSARAWQRLDALIGIVMLALAAGLIMSLF
ncbi:MAG: LysE/ArgO family amino acid transporter [Pseudomonadota bacterium]